MLLKHLPAGLTFVVMGLLCLGIAFSRAEPVTSDGLATGVAIVDVGRAFDGSDEALQLAVEWRRKMGEFQKQSVRYEAEIARLNRTAQQPGGVVQMNSAIKDLQRVATEFEVWRDMCDREIDQSVVIGFELVARRILGEAETLAHERGVQVVIPVFTNSDRLDAAAGMRIGSASPHDVSPAKMNASRNQRQSLAAGFKTITPIVADPRADLTDAVIARLNARFAE